MHMETSSPVVITHIVKPSIHNTSRARVLIGIISCGRLLTSALADDWPQWQGPDRNAISKEHGLLKEWPKEGPPLAWKTSGLGGGYSTPSVSAGRIFGMSTRGDDEVV